MLWTYMSEMARFGSEESDLEKEFEIKAQTFRRAQVLYKDLKKTTRSSTQSRSNYSDISQDIPHDGKQLALLDDGSAVKLLRRMNRTTSSKSSVAVHMKHTFANFRGPIKSDIVQAAFMSMEKEIKFISKLLQVKRDDKLSGILKSIFMMARRCVIILNKCDEGQLGREFSDFATDRFKAAYTLVQNISSVLQEIEKLEKPFGEILISVDLTPLSTPSNNSVSYKRASNDRKEFLKELPELPTLRDLVDNVALLIRECQGFVKGTEDLLRIASSNSAASVWEANAAAMQCDADDYDRSKATKFLEENPRLRSLYNDEVDRDYLPTCHVTVSQGQPASIDESIAKMKELNLFELEDYPGAASPHDWGSFGIVYKAPFVHDGLKVALKKFIVTPDKATTYKRITREAMIVSELNHENISPFYGYKESPAYEAIDIALVSPFYPQGNLRDFVRDTRKGVKPELVKVKLLRDVARALQYLHNPNKKGGIVIHGDLRAMNVLIGPNQKALLCDFGLATRTDLDPKWHTKTNETNDAYLAYEFFDLNKTKPIALSIKTDTYAFGCICYEVFYEDYPYHDVGDRHIPILKSKKEPPTTTNIPRKYRLEMGYRQLLARCWHPEPSRRPSATRLVEYLDEFVSFLSPPRS
ncbi:kinase-like protein [Schizopora paradoxa]|uniref:Kinase-like protein n=1 Tax=Schizopora paradoxa TaxID=27342 RepID=A0A0H2RGF4_9AGAM|nr:kinase-like protein [Schizopora paradoxa]